MSLPRQSDSLRERGFADWLEPWCAGYIAHREGIPNDDGAAIMARAQADFEKSGSERARRLLESGDTGAIDAAVRAVFE